MNRINEDFLRESFKHTVLTYRDATSQVGLWKSEEYIINKYFIDKEMPVLDMGCGTGRTTFPLYELGFCNIVGVDFSPDMIQEAETINTDFNTRITFSVGDCRDLHFESSSFSYGLFSFNGLMQIPLKKKRIEALKEISRVLTKGGIFFFTTHVREGDSSFLSFWEEEKNRWKIGQQDDRLFEFGDILSVSKKEGMEYFIHIPDMEEVLDSIKQADLTCIEYFRRSDLFEESKAVMDFSSDCVFWVVQKKN